MKSTATMKMSRRLCLASVVLMVCGALAARAHSPQALAVVNGQPVSSEEIETAATESLRRLEARRVQFDIEIKRERETALESALESIVEQRALAAEAAKRKISVDDLLEIEVNSAVRLFRRMRLWSSSTTRTRQCCKEVSATTWALFAHICETSSGNPFAIPLSRG